MIKGKDLSYCSYGDNSIIGNLALEDIITNSEVVIDTHYAYANCAGITSLSSYMINIGDYSYTYDYTYEEISHVDNVTYISTYNCYFYISYSYIIDYKETSMGYISDMSGMFLGSYNIKTADLRKMNISLCDNMDNMFADCKSLQTIIFGEYIPKINLHCEGIFKNCYNLETVYIPSSLKKEYANISGAALEHTIYYNHSDIDLKNIVYTYLKNSEIREYYRRIRFGLKHIGAFIIDDEINWDMIKMQINGETIFYMNYGDYKPTDELLKIKKHILLNEYYPAVNKEVVIDVYPDDTTKILQADLTVDVLYNYEVVKTVKERITVPINIQEYLIDIDSIYITDDVTYCGYINNSITFLKTDEYNQYTYTYTRWNPSIIRGNFNRTYFEYTFPDGELLKVINAQTGKEEYENEKIYGSYAYTFVDANMKNTLGYNNVTAYMIQFKDKNI